MKKNFKYFIIVISILTFNSCDHSIIDLDPISDNSVNSFYKTPNDFEIALTGLYRGFRDLYAPNYLDLFSETRSDNAINYFTTVGGGQYADFDNFTLGASNASLNNIWERCYVGIQRANIILNRIDNIEFSDPAIKSSISGETKFIRAMFYFDLVRLFGDVPLILDEIDDPTIAFGHTRTPKDEVYTQILKDLSEAESSLLVSLEDSQFGRPSKWAAKGMIARVYLAQNKHSEAEKYLKDIIDSKKFELEPQFSKVFEYSSNGNKEVIFAVRFMKDTQGAGYPYLNVNHDFQCSASLDFMDTFRNDPRLDATIDTSQIGIFYSPKKISLDLGSDNTTDINRIVLRMADVYLMMAEVLNEKTGSTDEALLNLNLIRNRVGLPSYSSVDLPSKENRLNAILEERRIELAFEDLRWFDLLRTGKALEVMNSKRMGGSSPKAASTLPYSPIKEFQLLYPIPQNQIDASGGSLIQNPGY